MLDFLKDPKNWLQAHRSRSFSSGLLLTFIILFLFFLGMMASPFLIPADTIHFGDVGAVGGDDFRTIIDGNITNPLANFYYKMGDLNCHQRESRSWHLNGNQLPFCARDTAIFFGLALGVLITLFFVFELDFLWIIAAFVPIGLDGGLQLVTSYESNNFFRLITGLLAGMATGIALGTIIREAGGLIEWRKEMKASAPGTEAPAEAIHEEFGEPADDNEPSDDEKITEN